MHALRHSRADIHASSGRLCRGTGRAAVTVETACDAGEMLHWWLTSFSGVASWLLVGMLPKALLQSEAWAAEYL